MSSHRGGCNPNRLRPTAFVDENPHGRARLKPIVLSTGRGDVKLTAAEAVDLAAELVRAAGESEVPPAKEGARRDS